MTTRMLIDARHQEETRVAVVKGNKIEEFDFESSEHKQLKGNIYLAKVTRVEPSLQAAFVDYGGNRHGFLAFPKSIPIIIKSRRKTANGCSLKKQNMLQKKPRYALRKKKKKIRLQIWSAAKQPRNSILHLSKSKKMRALTRLT